MKKLIIMVSLAIASVSYGEQEFDYKIYTPEVVVDSVNYGPKGAVQLLWQKNSDATRYEVEVSNGKLVYSQVGEKHFHHVMIYFDKDYQWRVREVSAQQTTEFSPWRPLKVVRAPSQQLAQTQNTHSDLKQREPVSVDSNVEPEVNEFLLDTGGQ